MELLRIEKLCKKYESFELKDMSFSLEEGYIMGFIGRNGAGKSTTFKAMLNLVHRDSGEVFMFGKDFYENELECKQQLGVVFGEADYYKRSRLRDLIDVCKRIYRSWDDELCAMYLKRFELDKEKRICELSSGMRVKFALTLALSHDARLLILDEPTSGLDPVSRDELVSVFRNIVSDGKRSIIFSTHITSDLDKCADYITYIKDGKLVATDTKDDFTDSFRIIKGKKDSLTDQLRDSLIGLKENSFGFSALCHTKNLPEGDFNISIPDLEEIMVYYERDDAQIN